MARTTKPAILALVVMLLMVVGGATPDPASGDPQPDPRVIGSRAPRDWGATAPTVNRAFNLRSCPSASCAPSGGLSAGQTVIDICRIGGVQDLVHSPTTAHAGFAPTHFLNPGRTGNQCSSIPFAPHAFTNTAFNLRSCPSLSCSASGFVSLGTLVTDVCFDSNGGAFWDLVIDRNNQAGFAPPHFIGTPTFTRTKNRCT
jgi:hypothetical protein